MTESASPPTVIALLRGLHARLETAVFEHEGTLDKFLGDGVMATFGTPEPGPRDAANALAAGRAMLRTVDEWNRDRSEERRVGKECVRTCISRWWTYTTKKTKKAQQHKKN